MNQLSLIENISDRLVWAKDTIAYSLSFDQDRIIKDIMRLYLKGQPFDADVTYSTGKMWKNLPQPAYKYDIEPQTDDTIQASCDQLPIEQESLRSIMFDPPFIPSHSPGNAGKIKGRFSSFKNLDEMLWLYNKALGEFLRVLVPGGVLVFKCQDQVSSGKNHIVHVDIINFARAYQYQQLDLFVLGSHHTMTSSTWKTQQHARKNHCYFLVFQTPKAKRRGKS